MVVVILPKLEAKWENEVNLGEKQALKLLVVELEGDVATSVMMKENLMLHDLCGNCVDEAKRQAECGTCNTLVRQRDRGLECKVCDTWFHIGCEKVTVSQYDFLMQDENKTILWTCNKCRSNIKHYARKLDKLLAECTSGYILCNYTRRKVYR